jgi:hypothetical protein
MHRDTVTACFAVDLFVARIEVVAGNGRCKSFRPRGVRAPAASRKTLRPFTAFERARAAIDLRLRPGNEGGQAIDAAGVCNDRLGLWLRLVLWLRAMFAFTLALAVFARLLLFALKWLSFALAAFAQAAFTDVRLRLHRDETGLLPEVRKTVTLVVAVITADHIVGAGLQLRLVLAELLLGRRDQAEVMLGVLVVVLGGNGVAGRPRIARELNVFLGHMRGGTANLDVRSVGLENTGHRVLAAPVIVTIIVVVIIVVPVAHTLVVLTVSHVLPLFQPRVKSVGLMV